MNITIDKILQINDSIYAIINQISLSLLILLIGFIIGKLVGKFILLILNNSNIKKIKIFSIKFDAEKTIPTSISYLIYIASLIFALSYSGILKVVIYVFMIIFSLVVIVSAFYSIKQVIPNLIASISLTRNPNFKKRKKIKIEGIIGEISDITYSEVKITTEAGEEIHIPCKLFLEKEYVLLK